MGTATSSPAGQNAHAAHAARMAEAKAKRDAAKAAAATLTPLADAPAETAEPSALFPDDAANVAPRPLVLSVTILYRGRQITIASEGRTLDQFCDLLDKRLGVAS